METAKKKTRLSGMLLILSFLIPVGIILTKFIVSKIYPFGDRCFLASDLYHQYMPFFAEFLRKVKDGEGIAYSYNVGIGSNFTALYVYYLASPLHYLAFLLPEAHLIEFIGYLMITKIGLCGMSFYWYLKEHYKHEEVGMLLFSCFYALSGYVTAYNWNIMWLDCIILAPLVILGLEKLVKEGRCALYCVALALSIFSNFYISIMMCIFVVLYFIKLFITEKKNVRMVLRFVLYSLLAGGMAAVLLIPEVCAMLQTSFGDPNFPKKVESYFPILDVIARHSVGVPTERGLDHWPNIYCGVAVFMLIPIYVFNKKISIKKRFVDMVIVGFFLLSFSTNLLDFLWHGLNYPDSLPARQSFLYVFLILIMSYEAYYYIKQMDAKYIMYGYAAAMGYLLWCEKFVGGDDFKLAVKIQTVVFVTIYAVLLYYYHTRQKSVWCRRMVVMIAIVVVVIESGLNYFRTAVGTTSRTAYLEGLDDYKILYDWTHEQEDGDEFYRMEKFTRKTKNDGTLVGYPTASVFSSTLNSAVKELYKSLGMHHSKVYYGYDGATALTSAMLNVKYLYGEDENYENSLFTKVNQSGNIHLFEAVNTLPFGYVIPLGYDLPKDCPNGLELQNSMVRALGCEDDLFTKVYSESNTELAEYTPAGDGIYYGLVTAYGTKKVELNGGSLETEKYKDLKKNSIFYLGDLWTGETVTIKNDDNKDQSKEISVDVYLMDETILKEAIEILSSQHMEDVSYDDRHIKGRITMKQPGRLVLSVPYENGWKITVNGQKTQSEKFGDAFIALSLGTGEYDIAMTYTPEGKYAGILVTLISIIVFGGIMTWKQKSSSKNQNK